MNTKTPQYQHDCTKCKFLGRFTSDGINYDLYFCVEGNGNRPTVIARYDNDGGDYASGIMFNSPELTEAKRRAKALGYITDKDIK